MVKEEELGEKLEEVGENLEEVIFKRIRGWVYIGIAINASKFEKIKATAFPENEELQARGTASDVSHARV